MFLENFAKAREIVPMIPWFRQVDFLTLFFFLKIERPLDGLA